MGLQTIKGVEYDVEYDGNFVTATNVKTKEEKIYKNADFMKLIEGSDSSESLKTDNKKKTKKVDGDKDKQKEDDDIINDDTSKSKKITSEVVSTATKNSKDSDDKSINSDLVQIIEQIKKAFPSLSLSGKVESVNNVDDIKIRNDDRVDLKMAAQMKVEEIDGFLSSDLTIKPRMGIESMFTFPSVSNYKTRIFKLAENVMPLRYLKRIALPSQVGSHDAFKVIINGDVPPAVKDSIDAISMTSTAFVLWSCLDDIGFLRDKVDSIIKTTTFRTDTVATPGVVPVKDDPAMIEFRLDEVVSHIFIASFTVFIEHLKILRERQSYNYTLNNSSVPVNEMQDDDLAFYSYYLSKYKALSDASESISNSGLFDKIGKSGFFVSDPITMEKMVKVFGSQNIDPQIADRVNLNLRRLINNRVSYQFIEQIVRYLTKNKASIVPDIDSWKHMIFNPLTSSEIHMSFYLVLKSQRIMTDYLHNSRLTNLDIISDNLSFMNPTEIISKSTNSSANNLEYMAMSSFAQTIDSTTIAELLLMEVNAPFINVTPYLHSTSSDAYIDDFTVLLGIGLLRIRHQHMWRGHMRYHLGKMLDTIFWKYADVDHAHFNNTYYFDSDHNTTAKFNEYAEYLVPSIFVHYQNHRSVAIRDYMNFLATINNETTALEVPPEGLPFHGNGLFISTPAEPEIMEGDLNGAQQYRTLYMHASRIITPKMRRIEANAIKESLKSVWANNGELASRTDSVFSYIKYQAFRSPFSLPSFLGFSDPDTHIITYDLDHVKTFASRIIRYESTLDLKLLVSCYFGMTLPSNTTTKSGMLASSSMMYKQYDVLDTYKRFDEFTSTNVARMTNANYVTYFQGYLYNVGSTPMFSDSLIDWVKSRKQYVSASTAKLLLNNIDARNGDDSEWARDIADLRVSQPSSCYGTVDANDEYDHVVPPNTSSLPNVTNYFNYQDSDILERMRESIDHVTSCKYTMITKGVILAKTTVPAFDLETEVDTEGYEEKTLKDLITENRFKFSVINGNKQIAMFTWDDVDMSQNFPKLHVIITDKDNDNIQSNAAINAILYTAIREGSFILSYVDKVMRLYPDYALDSQNSEEQQIELANIVINSPINSILGYKVPVTNYHTITGGVVRFTMPEHRFIYFGDVISPNVIVHGPMENREMTDLNLANIVPDDVIALHNYAGGENVTDGGRLIRKMAGYERATTAYTAQLSTKYEIGMGKVSVR